jgi:hypothetical protein
MKVLRRLLWVAPVAGMLLLTQCQSSTAPRIPEPDRPDEKEDSIPSTAFRVSPLLQA